MYRRITTPIRPSGAGGQFDSRSVPGDLCWRYNVIPPSAFFLPWYHVVPSPHNWEQLEILPSQAPSPAEGWPGGAPSPEQNKLTDARRVARPQEVREERRG